MLHIIFLENRKYVNKNNIIPNCPWYVSVFYTICGYFWIRKCSFHYENLPMQYTEIFFSCKKLKFHQKNIDIFLIFAQNTGCGYSLELPRRGGSNV